MSVLKREKERARRGEERERIVIATTTLPPPLLSLSLPHTRPSLLPDTMLHSCRQSGIGRVAPQLTRARRTCTSRDRPTTLAAGVHNHRMPRYTPRNNFRRGHSYMSLPSSLFFRQNRKKICREGERVYTYPRVASSSIRKRPR